MNTCSLITTSPQPSSLYFPRAQRCLNSDSNVLHASASLCTCWQWWSARLTHSATVVSDDWVVKTWRENMEAKLFTSPCAHTTKAAEGVNERPVLPLLSSWPLHPGIFIIIPIAYIWLLSWYLFWSSLQDVLLSSCVTVISFALSLLWLSLYFSLPSLLLSVLLPFNQYQH